MLFPYINSWATQTSHAIEIRATKGVYLLAGEKEKVNALENLKSLVVEGWRDDNGAQAVK